MLQAEPVPECSAILAWPHLGLPHSRHHSLERSGRRRVMVGALPTRTWEGSIGFACHRREDKFFFFREGRRRGGGRECKQGLDT